MLQKVRNDLSDFLCLVDNQLGKLNYSDNSLDMWKAAIIQLENLDEAEKQ